VDVDRIWYLVLENGDENGWRQAEAQAFSGYPARDRLFEASGAALEVQPRGVVPVKLSGYVDLGSLRFGMRQVLSIVTSDK
jgi:hypothetical protein